MRFRIFSTIFFLTFFDQKLESSPIYVYKTIINNQTVEKNDRIMLSNEPILSSHMKPHTYDYRPRGFVMHTKKLSDKKILIEFNFSQPFPYVNYIIRMRYHGHRDEYMTHKISLDKNSTNRVILKNFPYAQYVLCVTLFPSMTVSSLQYPHISSSDMCTDITFGEEHHVSVNHNKTGLLVPVLLLLVFIQLFVIATVHKFKNSKCCITDEQKEIIIEEEKTNSLKRSGLNSVAGLNYLVNFNQDYSDMTHLVKMMMFHGTNKFLKNQHNKPFESDASLRTQFSEHVTKRKLHDSISESVSEKPYHQSSILSRYT